MIVISAVKGSLTGRGKPSVRCQQYMCTHVRAQVVCEGIQSVELHVQDSTC